MVESKNYINLSLFFKLINTLNIKSALDAGMTIINNRWFSRQFLEDEISKDVVLDCIDYSDGQCIVPIYETVFNHIYTIHDDITYHYELMNLIGQLQKINKKYIMNFLIECLDIADIIVFDIGKNNSFLKEQLGIFYEKSNIIDLNDDRHEYRIIKSVDIVQEIIIRHMESGQFKIAEQLLNKYKNIYKNCEELMMIEPYIKKGLGEY